MKGFIWQRCPKCGKWCIALGKNASDRFIDDVIDYTDVLGEFGDEHLGNFGKLLGKVWGGYSGTLSGIANAIVGDHYQFYCTRCGSKWSTNDDTKDETELYDQWQKQRQACFNCRSILSSNNRSEIDEYIKFLSGELNKKETDEESIAIIHDTLAVVYHEQNDRQQALNHINQSLSLYDDDNSRALKGIILDRGRNSLDSYKAMRELIHYKQAENESLYFTVDDFKTKFEDIQGSYISHFLEIPQHQRRFVFLISGNLDDKLTQLPDELFALPIGFLPTEMHFEGTPTEQILYVCHPYKPNLYIPYDRYDLELFRDELREFCWVMDCLGAKRIDFTDIQSKKYIQDSDESNNIHGGGGYKGKGSGNFDYNSEYSNEFDESTKELLKDGRTFDLSTSTPPYIPDDIVWYQHNQEWQRDCTSRLEGRLKERVFTISTISSIALSESKRQQLEAEINVMLVELSAGAEHKENIQLKKTEVHTAKCHVEFYPLSDYKIDKTSKNDIKKILSPNQGEKKINWLVLVMGGIMAALAIGLAIALL